MSCSASSSRQRWSPSLASEPVESTTSVKSTVNTAKTIASGHPYPLREDRGLVTPDRVEDGARVVHAALERRELVVGNAV